jgi:hypothetical protein
MYTHFDLWMRNFLYLTCCKSLYIYIFFIKIIPIIGEALSEMANGMLKWEELGLYITSFIKIE